jgi:hypothetical protein
MNKEQAKDELINIERKSQFNHIEQLNLQMKDLYSEK